jgi:hypothetical protein
MRTVTVIPGIDPLLPTVIRRFGAANYVSDVAIEATIRASSDSGSQSTTVRVFSCTARRQRLVESYISRGARMKHIFALGFFALFASGCATQMVEKNANDSCAAQGKKAFIFDAKQSGIPLLVESASAMVICVGPEGVTHLPTIFGADAVSSSNFNGAGILSVTPGAIADKAGLKPNDIVYEFGDRPIDHARDLGVAIDSMASGDQALIKLRRNGTKGVTVTARF